MTLAPSGVDRWFEMTKRNEYQYDFLYRTHVNIGVDPKVVCHTEHSEVSLFSAFLRSFTFVQDDKFTQKMKHESTAILLPIFYLGLNSGTVGRCLPALSVQSVFRHQHRCLLGRRIPPYNCNHIQRYTKPLNTRIPLLGRSWHGRGISILSVDYFS